MSVNVSKCSGWDGRVNELGEMSRGSLDTRDAYPIGDKSVWRMAYSRSKDIPLHSGPYAIGYTP